MDSAWTQRIQQFQDIYLCKNYNSKKLFFNPGLLLLIRDPKYKSWHEKNIIIISAFRFDIHSKL